MTGQQPKRRDAVLGDRLVKVHLVPVRKLLHVWAVALEERAAAIIVQPAQHHVCHALRRDDVDLQRLPGFDERQEQVRTVDETATWATHERFARRLDRLRE